MSYQWGVKELKLIRGRITTSGTDSFVKREQRTKNYLRSSELQEPVREGSYVLQGHK
jgi:hypothetical protein